MLDKKTMETPFEDQIAALEAQLKQIKNEKELALKAELQAAERQKVAIKQGLIDDKATWLDNAKKQRALAAAAQTLKDREAYLAWAKEAETAAAAIVIDDDQAIETIQTQPESNPIDQEIPWNLIQVLRNFKLAAVAFAVFVLLYVGSRLVPIEVVSNVLEQASRVAYAGFLVALIIAITFWIMNRYFGILMDYMNESVDEVSMENDFKMGTKDAAVRLAFYWACFMGLATLLLVAMEQAGLI